jgi:hypothetical protein
MNPSSLSYKEKTGVVALLIVHQMPEIAEKLFGKGAIQECLLSILTEKIRDFRKIDTSPVIDADFRKIKPAVKKHHNPFSAKRSTVPKKKIFWADRPENAEKAKKWKMKLRHSLNLARISNTKKRTKAA